LFVTATACGKPFYEDWFLQFFTKIYSHKWGIFITLNFQFWGCKFAKSHYKKDVIFWHVLVNFTNLLKKIEKLQKIENLANGKNQ